MEYLNKILKKNINFLDEIRNYGKTPVAGGALGESPAPNSEIDEKTIYSTFNNYDMALTITLKGSNNRKIESLKGDIHKQYLYLVGLYKEYIIPNMTHYVAHFELHKCGEWLHTHALISIRSSNKTQQAKALKNIRANVFYEINGRKLKAGETYKTRILVEKLHTVETWYNYIKKDEPIMRSYDDRIIKLFKLQSINTKNTPMVITL